MIICFVHETNIFSSDSDLLRLKSVLNSELDKVYNWLAVNKFTLNLARNVWYLYKSTVYITNMKEQLPGLELMFIDEQLDWKHHDCIDTFHKTKCSDISGIIYKGS